MNASLIRKVASSVRSSEWAIDGLDVEAYLARIGYEGDTSAEVKTLHALHRAHVASIPFENLNILLGRGLSLELDDIQEKLLRNPRGGYCFEHNLLFAALLERLGFGVTRLAARVQPDRPGPRTHMCLVVEASGERWLADVGFGTALLEAISLRDGAISRQEGWNYGLGIDAAGFWVLRALEDDSWVNQYAFTLEPQRPVDYIVHNHYTSTHPASPFVNQLVALRKTTEQQYALRGRDLIISKPGQSPNRRQIEASELGELLNQHFGIVLNGDDLSQLGALYNS